MNEIILMDDALTSLEAKYGSIVRRIGSWITDGTFGYCSVDLAAVKKAGDALNDSAVLPYMQQFDNSALCTPLFMEMLDKFGTALIEEIVAARQQRLFVRSAT
jgi:hypothetical protein